MNEENIPIDIHFNKLLDWLVDRRHCHKQWQGSSLSIREKINAAIQDMPPVDEITRLLQGTYINYFHCAKITEILKATDDGTKNIFGRYSSQRMKDWVEILSLYENEGVYLAEAAQMLIRNVNYEVPALKRQISKCQQAQKESTRKEAEYASNSSELKDKYFSACRQMGIKGIKVKAELLELAKDLPSTFDKIERSTKELEAGCGYYSDFVTFMLSSSPDCLPMLKYMIERGNTTVYEWKYGEAPTRVEPPPSQCCEDAEDQTLEDPQEEAEIDWGNLDEVEAEPDKDQDANSDGAIDWGADEQVSQVTIEVVDDSTGELPNSQGGVARGDEALTLLDNPETQKVFINELLELQCFLCERQEELADDSSVLSGTQFHTAPASVQIGRDTTTQMLSKVTDITDKITSKNMQDLFLIRSSPRYVDRMAETLKKTLQDSEKMMSLSRLMVQKHQEALLEEKNTQPKLELIRQKTKELQKQIEKEISGKYKNRRVNIMGEINTI